MNKKKEIKGKWRSRERQQIDEEEERDEMT